MVFFGRDRYLVISENIGASLKFGHMPHVVATEWVLLQLEMMQTVCMRYSMLEDISIHFIR